MQEVINSEADLVAGLGAGRQRCLIPKRLDLAEILSLADQKARPLPAGPERSELGRPPPQESVALQRSAQSGQYKSKWALASSGRSGWLQAHQKLACQ